MACSTKCSQVCSRETLLRFQMLGVLLCGPCAALHWCVGSKAARNWLAGTMLCTELSWTVAE